MKTIRIRFAKNSDAVELAKLRLALRSRPITNIEDQSAFLERCTKWITDAVEQTKWRCWVAEQDEVLVGALWLQLVEKVPNPTPEPEQFAYITNFFITESARGRGLGSRMLNEAIRWCRDQNVHLMILWSRKESRSLYERHGFTIGKDLLQLSLTGDN